MAASCQLDSVAARATAYVYDASRRGEMAVNEAHRGNELNAELRRSEPLPFTGGVAIVEVPNAFGHSWLRLMQRMLKGRGKHGSRSRPTRQRRSPRQQS